MGNSVLILSRLKDYLGQQGMIGLFVFLTCDKDITPRGIPCSLMVSQSEGERKNISANKSTGDSSSSLYCNVLCMRTEKGLAGPNVRQNAGRLNNSSRTNWHVQIKTGPKVTYSEAINNWTVPSFKAEKDRASQLLKHPQNSSSSVTLHLCTHTHLFVSCECFFHIINCWKTKLHCGNWVEQHWIFSPMYARFYHDRQMTSNGIKHFHIYL